MNQLAHLLADRLDDPRRAMAKQVTAPAGEEIEVAVPLGIPDPGPLAPNQAYREAPIIGDHVPIELRDRRVRALRGNVRRWR